MLFDEVALPLLLADNRGVVTATSRASNCDLGGVWMWYKGQMQGRRGGCVIHHFGGGGARPSRLGKEAEWARDRAFFAGGFHASGLHGFGSAKRGGGHFSFVFTFGAAGEFVVVNSTNSFAPGFDSVVLLRVLAEVAGRFLSPAMGGAC